MSKYFGDKLQMFGLGAFLVFLYFLFVLIPGLFLDAWVVMKMTPMFFPNVVMPEKYQVMGGILLIGLVFGSGRSPTSSKKDESLSDTVFTLLGFLSPIFRPLFIYGVGLFVLAVVK